VDTYLEFVTIMCVTIVPKQPLLTMFNKTLHDNINNQRFLTNNNKLNGIEAWILKRLMMNITNYIIISNILRKINLLGFPIV